MEVKGIDIKTKLPKRDVAIQLTLSDLQYDDNQILSNRGIKNYKIHKIFISHAKNMYLTGLNFEYLNLDNGQVIKGNTLKARTKTTKTKEFELSKNEFVVAVRGRKGMIIDKIGFQTSDKRILQFGGQGGSPFEYSLRPGYHMGAVTLCYGGFLSGFQFDYKSIPKYQHQTIAINLFENLTRFDYITKYLHCHEILRLFLVSKSVAQYRLYSAQFWLKCLRTYDIDLIEYLKRLSTDHHIQQLKEMLQKLGAIDLIPQIKTEGKMQINTIRTKFRIPTEVQGLVQDQYYLLIVSAKFLNYEYVHRNCMLEFEGPMGYFVSQAQDEDTKKQLNIKQSIVTRKIAILFKNDTAVKKDLESSLFEITASTTMPQFDFFTSKIIKIQANMIPVSKGTVPINRYKKAVLDRQLYVNHSNSNLVFDYS